VILYVAGATVGAAAIGVVIELVHAPASHLAANWRWLILGATAVVLASADLHFMNLRTPSWNRQTGSQWPRIIGPRRAWFAWGADMALGFSTIRVTSLFWLATVAAVLVVPWPYGFAAAGAYAMGLAMALISATWSMRRHSALEPTFSEIRLLGLSSAVARVSAIICLVAAGAAVTLGVQA
jgi:hypothetical protein